MDIDKITTPSGEQVPSVQAKYTISIASRDKLRAASKACGQDMSTLIDWLIRDHLSLTDAELEGFSIHD